MTNLHGIQVSDDPSVEPNYRQFSPSPGELPHASTRQFQLQGLVSPAETRQPTCLTKADSEMLRSSGKCII